MFSFFTKDKPASGRVRMTIEVDEWVVEAVRAFAERQEMSPAEYGGHLLRDGFSLTVPREEWQEEWGLFDESTLTVRTANWILVQAFEIETKEFVLVPLDEYIEMRYRIDNRWDKVVCKMPDEPKNVPVIFWPSVVRRYELMSLGKNSSFGIIWNSRVYDLTFQRSELHYGSKDRQGLQFEIKEKHL